MMSAHSCRFRKVSTRYPRRVAEAYARDLDRAMDDSDEQVAAVVAAWEETQGLEPVDWAAVGAEERAEVPGRVRTMLPPRATPRIRKGGICRGVRVPCGPSPRACLCRTARPIGQAPKRAGLRLGPCGLLLDVIQHRLQRLRG